MPRRKMKRTTKAKANKTATKRQIKSPTLTLAEHIEKDFRDVPAKLAALYGKDLSTLKQKEKKLQAQLHKAQTQMKTVKNKHVALTAKAKTNATAKKQLSKSKKFLDTLNTAITKLIAELDQHKSLGKQLAYKQTKFTTLGKQLLKLEKELDLKQKKAITAKPRKKLVKKTVTTQKQTVMQDAISETETQTQEHPTPVTRNDLVELDS